MTVDENIDTADAVQPAYLWINPTTTGPVAAVALGLVGENRQLKSPPKSTGHPTLCVIHSTPMEIDHGPPCHQRAVATSQQTTGTVTFASSRQEQEISVQLKDVPASNARLKVSPESLLSSSSNISRHDRVIIDAIVVATFQ